MTMTVEKFRELAERRKASVKQGGARYTPAEQEWALAWAEQSGLSRSRAARELGIADPTLRHWVSEAKARSSGTFERVHVVRDARSVTPHASRSATALTLRTAQGHELGPLDVETAVALLRALS